jgi:polyisoprenoid-binding protein YceI
MVNEIGLKMPIRNTPGGPARKRHWWRWILAGAVALVVIIAVAAALVIKLQPVPAPLALPRAAASAPAGPVDGRWDVAAGSVAGFRVRESALGISNDTVGRTSAVTGAIVLSGDQVTAATLRVDLARIKVGGKAQPQFATSLGTRADPVATFTLTRPVVLSPAFTSGAAISVTATGRLAMHGASRLVTVTISGRRSGSALQVAGSIPIAFGDWGIKGPKSYGFLASLADHGVAEFLLVLHRQ